MQAALSTCVQKSCGFLDQNQVVAFASGLCEAYPKETRVHELKTASIVTIVLAIIFLFLRLYSRWLKTQRLWSDNAYAIIAAVLLIAVSAIILEMSLKGFGLHYWNVQTANAVVLLKLFYVCQMLYIAVQIFSKVAILALYSRLFPDFIKWFRWTVRGMITFMVCTARTPKHRRYAKTKQLIHGLVFLILVVFQCVPVKSIWDKTIADAKCLPVSAAIGFTGAGLSIVEDIIILLLPLPLVWKLQMSTRKKVGIIFLISVGSFASITSIVRLKYVVKYSNSFDATWDNVDVIKWSLIEILSACICGNLLPLRPLIDQIMPPFRSIYSWYSDHRSSQRTSEKTSLGFRSFGRFGRSSRPSRPKLISTLQFTQMSLSPSPTQGWDWKHSGKSEQHTMASPRPMTHAHFERNPYNVGDSIDDVHELQDETTGMAFTASLESPQSETTSEKARKTMKASIDRSSRDGSESGLMPPPRNREQRISGPWSCALAILDRR
ncbi:hypothetical protein SLS60_009617 [Paraconiothyrium brasiliense]|uniref:Rhodopsin domain-containing protein n=1 Tax=Paraconiothyrium brasiliense TaxID=300254 RepID=A0ABR3QUU1_9PLEO